jgi:hypothetical protein
MAQVLLSAAGAAVGGPAGGAVGGSLGAMLDRAAVESLRPPREVGPRLQSLQVMSAADGAPVPAVFGRARIAGQVIWAARFKAARVERSAGGGKGGPRTMEEAYSLSFAVALGEGPIDGVGRVWADGKPMDMTGVTMRVHLGGEDQAPDPLIEAVEGEAPAYRGTAYAVFEDLALGPFGNRPPQLSFEVMRRPRGDGPGLEERLKGVCLIPGAGEFVYATEPVLRREGLTRARAENVNNTMGGADLLVSLDQLQAQLPEVRSVTLVVSWFGDDLRAGECQVRPGVEAAGKHTLPFAWRAGGVDRSGARLLAGADGRPAYGGTPADATVLQIIAELKRRGLAVTLYPFLMMDVRPGNGLPDPYGGAAQAVFPWRGRISCHPAPGRPGSPDGGVEAAAQVARFFGAATADQFAVVDGEVRFSGAEWSWSRMVLHYARLAELAGGVDAFLIGSELRGLTWVRDGVNSYPAVQALRRLAGECRKVLRPETALSYAADWSEWFGHQPADGSGHAVFHLDPLWADPAISFVGVDWYPPGADWRDGRDHLDALAGFDGPHDPAYLASQVAGGEGFDWFYASAADRGAQVRTPITDGVYGEPWMFRPKDIASWWGRAHHDRPNGVRAAEPTAWTPRSKPVQLVEFGCAAVDKGANSPNLFYDPKSAESGLPPFSDGRRDDLGQRRAVEAVLAHFDQPENNPVSEVYGGPMVDGVSAWCWDARPFPDFPGRPRVWADAPNWTYGHWLNGRAGVAPAAELLAAVLRRGKVGPGEVDLSEARGSVTGYVIDHPMSLREAVTPLLEVFGLDAAERDGKLAVVARDGPALLSLDDEGLALPERATWPERRTRSLDERPSGGQARFIDEAGEYRTAAVSVMAETPGMAGRLSMDLPVVTGPALVEDGLRRRLARAEAEADDRTVHLGPEAALRLEAGDRVRLGAEPQVWRVIRLDLDGAPTAKLTRAERVEAGAAADTDWRPGEPVEPPAPPVVHLLDLGALPGEGVVSGPLVAAAGEPWRAVNVLAGGAPSALTSRARVAEPVGLGVTLSGLDALAPGRLHPSATLSVQLEGARLQARSWAEVAAGASTLAVLQSSGEWELLQFLWAELIGPDRYQLTGLVRGQAGTDAAVTGDLAPGAPVVLVGSGLVRAALSDAERGAELLWRAVPAGAVATVSTSEQRFTWRGLQGRPWSPCRLRAERTVAGGLQLSWTPRASAWTEAWDGSDDPPSAELFQVTVVVDGALRRTWETSERSAAYPPELLEADLEAAGGRPLSVEIRQGGPGHGWGAPARGDLWL